MENSEKFNPEQVRKFVARTAANKKRWEIVSFAFREVIEEKYLQDMDDMSEEEVEWWDDESLKFIGAESRRIFMLGLEADRKNREAENPKKRK